MKRILVDVDTQKHFFLDDGPMRVRNHQKVLANIRKIMAWARARRIHTVSTVQLYASNTIYANSYAGGGLSLKKIDSTLSQGRISLDATDWADVSGDVVDQHDQVLLHKRCFDPFEEPRIDRILTEVDADEFILIGAATEGAVKATALGLLARGKNVTVVADATGSLNTAAAKAALRCMSAKGATLASVETVLGRSSLRSAKQQRLGCYRVWTEPKTSKKRTRKRHHALLGPYPLTGTK